MVPSGPGTPIGGVQSVTPSLLRSNSGMLGGQGGSMPSQGGFPSLVSPRNHQFNNANLLGNVPNVPSLLNQSFGNNGPSPGVSGNGPRSGVDGGAESDPLSGMGNGMGFNPSSSFAGPNMGNPGSSGHVHGQPFSSSSGSQMLTDQPVPDGLSGVGPVKMEPQVNNDQHGPGLRGLGQVKMEQQSLPSMRGLAPVKMEPQHSDPSLFLQQQQQQQQQLLQQMSMSRPPSQAAAAQMNLLQQQRLLQIQQQQQQNQLLKAIPQLRPQLQQQILPHNMPLRQPVKPYEPGMCARRLTHYMYQQQHRPEDNNIDFWRKFVAEYFAPNAKKKWCVSMYGSGRQTTGVFPQDVWHCEICKRKPGRGFEATVEVLPRLLKIKYESGTLEELLYVDMPREYQNSSGQIVLDYAKAIQESVFDQLRVVRDGQLRIVFSPDLKICSWEFCARRHEELIPRRLLIPQVSQLGNAAQKYQTATQTSSSNMSVSDLQSNCNMFVTSARQLAKALEVPLVNDLGYTKRYVRCLQISEVVNSMKDLIDYSRLTGAGPMESLAKFPRRMVAQSGPQGQSQQPEEQQPQPQSQQLMMQSSNNNDQNCVQSGPMQIASNNGVAGQNNGAIAGLLHQNSMNLRHQNPMNNANSPFGGSSVQMLSPGSSSTMQAQQPSPSPFQSPTPSASNNPPQANHVNSANSPALSNIQQPTLSNDGDTNDTQSSVQKIIKEMMMNNQINGILPTGRNPVLNGANCLVGNGPTSSNMSMGGGASFGGMGGGTGQASMVNGIRAAMGNRAGIQSMVQDQSMGHQPQDLGNQMLGELGTVNGFNGVQFDWKSL